MKVIRKFVFETNSSSTHSVSISKRGKYFVEIPNNKKDYDICKEIDLGYNEDIITKVEKLRYLYSLVAMYISEVLLNEEDEVPPVFVKYRSKYLTDVLLADKAFDECKEELYKFNWLKWLNELVEKETGTTIMLSRATKELPFFSDFHSCDELGALDILDIENGKETDELYMKSLFHRIVFEDYVIKDREEEN